MSDDSEEPKYRTPSELSLLSLRPGYADGGLTAGAGFAVNNARVDYAYVTQRALSKENVHRISLSDIW